MTRPTAKAFWIILATTSNPAEDLTGVIAVTSIQRHYNAVTVIVVTVGMLGVGETEQKTLPTSSGRDTPLHRIH